MALLGKTRQDKTPLSALPSSTLALIAPTVIPTWPEGTTSSSVLTLGAGESSPTISNSPRAPTEVTFKDTESLPGRARLHPGHGACLRQGFLQAGEYTCKVSTQLLIGVNRR